MKLNFFKYKSVAQDTIESGQTNCNITNENDLSFLLNDKLYKISMACEFNNENSFFSEPIMFQILA